MSGPYLIRMSDAAFADIPNKVVPRTVRLKDPTLAGPAATKWIFIGYCEKLLYKNAKLVELLVRFAGRVDDADCWSQLTEGQRALHSLATFDGQVRNGGITQFFWNCPDLVIAVSEALTALGESELATAYEKALASLVGNMEAWSNLRNQSEADPEEFWEPFQASYELLDLNWFDDSYFEKYGPALVVRLVDYVRASKHEFIEF
jgi:hypothetical protein